MSLVLVAAVHPTHMPAGAPADLRALLRTVASGLGEDGADVSLRVWTPLGATLTLLCERAPATRDLRDGATPRDERTVAYDAGRWTDGAREYELVIALPGARAGDEMLAARIAVVVADEVAARTPIAVTWTDDERLIAAGGGPPGPGNAGAEAIADLPTGPSPEPRHTVVLESQGATSCPACDLPAADGDRFCERCGRELADAQQS